MTPTDLPAWRSLHDGELLHAEGHVPGELSLRIAAPYLRDAFQPPGEAFVLRLGDCTRLQLVRDDGEVLDDPAMICGRAPVLLSIASDSPLAIYTTAGLLRLEYATLAMALDTGQPVSPEDLDAASGEYWTAWPARSTPPALDAPTVPPERSAP